MKRFAVILVLAMALYWVIMSGIFTVWILFLGVVSIALVTALCWRMKILDAETVPYMHAPKALSYYVWLFIEIIKANVAVLRAVLSPDMEVSPSLLKVSARQRTAMGRTSFANSITLTPGTVSVDMLDDEILVHALLSEMTDPAGFADMGDRAAWSVGEDHTGADQSSTEGNA